MTGKCYKLRRVPILPVLVVGLCVALVLFLVKAVNQKAIHSISATEHPVTKESVTTSAPFNPQTNVTLTSAPKLPDAGNNAAVSASEKKTLPESAIPTGIIFKPTTFLGGNENLSSILAAVSNAVLSVDNILKTQNYKVHEFSRTKWLVAEDKEHSAVWTIFPYKTNAVVGSVEAVIYKDVGMTQKDPTQSFQMSFYPETGALRDFWWGDDHEVLCVQTNDASDYGRDLGGKMKLTMRWDNKGKLIFSNVYDRTNRKAHWTTSTGSTFKAAMADFIS